MGVRRRGPVLSVAGGLAEFRRPCQECRVSTLLPPGAFESDQQVSRGGRRGEEGQGSQHKRLAGWMEIHMFVCKAINHVNGTALQVCPSCRALQTKQRPLQEPMFQLKRDVIYPVIYT